ncbi:sugar ABC transporter substrate-binding protein [Alkaliphilus serpentinus]|uniref:Maltodextrin-binding protein n=1 Tax=Alkaliphilus serpentinus TaxID=1482731 RepID=A0A833HMV7_9FIRM|nr:maltose ABC transporter substrate-binding protein [Alkaliphilus serpentinus]KAB3528807.1 maltose ABC transporter substrate-binding protein [Alkaliphilus serpentinus]
MKRLISVALLITMFVVLLAGCSTSTSSEIGKFDPEQEVTLRVWHGWTGQEEAALIEATKQFTAKHPKIQFDLLYTPFEGGYKDKLKASIQTGDGPDIFFGPHDWTGEFAVANMVQAIDDGVKSVKGDYIPSTYEAGAYAGKHYGYPMSMEAIVLIYNKDLVTEAPKTITEMVNIAKENTKGENWGIVFDYNGIFYFTHPFFSGFGNEIFNFNKDDEAVPNFNNEAFIAYLDFLDKLKNEEKVMPKQLDYGTAQALFMEGKAAFWINGPWSFGDLEAAGVNWGATTFPKNDITGNESKPFMGVKMAFMSKESQNKAAANEFAKFMASAEIAKMFNEMVGTVPANTKVGALDKWTDQLIQEQAKSAIAMPAIPEMGQVWTPVKDGIDSVLDSNGNPSDVANTVQTTIEQAIKEAKGE